MAPFEFGGKIATTMNHIQFVNQVQNKEENVQTTSLQYIKSKASRAAEKVFREHANRAV